MRVYESMLSLERLGRITAFTVATLAALFATRPILAQETPENPAVYNQEIVLQNGSRIVGRIVRMEKGNLYFESKFGNNVFEIAFEEVVEIRSDVENEYVLRRGTKVVGGTAPSDEGGQGVDAPNLAGNPRIDIGDIVAINPEPARLIRNRGNITVTGTIDDTSGGREKEFIVLLDYSVRIGQKRRLSLLGQWEYGEDAGVVDQREGFLFGKYDYFFNDLIFFYGTSRIDGDDFDDLNLRTSVGVGLGVQFIDDETTSLYVETGTSFVNEDFDIASDDQRLAQRLSGRLDHVLIEDKLSLFHFFEGFLSYEDQQDSNIFTQTGVRLTVIDNFYATAQVNFDYDNQPSPGEPRKEVQYLLGLGYSFNF